MSPYLSAGELSSQLESGVGEGDSYLLRGQGGMLTQVAKLTSLKLVASKLIIA